MSEFDATSAKPPPVRASYYADRYGQNCDSLSVDYRKAEERILRGAVPKKYKRLLPHVPGGRILEVGAGEGVLSLALSAHKQWVTAIDMTPARHEKGKQIRSVWRALGRDVERCELVLGDIFEHEHLIHGADTLVACRVIYYFRERMDALLELARRHVRYVCLVGAGYRSRRWARGEPSPDIGEYAYYSTVDGMRALLERHRFVVTFVDEEGDPIVIGEAADSSRSKGT